MSRASDGEAHRLRNRVGGVAYRCPAVFMRRAVDAGAGKVGLDAVQPAVEGRGECPLDGRVVVTTNAQKKPRKLTVVAGLLEVPLALGHLFALVELLAGHGSFAETVG